MELDLRPRIGGYIAFRSATNSDTEETSVAVVKIDDEFIRRIQAAISVLKTGEFKSIWGADISFGVGNLYFLDEDKGDLEDMLEKYDFVPVNFSSEDEEDVVMTEGSKITVLDDKNITLSSYSKATGAEFFATISFKKLMDKLMK